MPSYTQKSVGTCCDDPSYEQQAFEDDGQVAYSHSVCTNCGAEWRDVYSYLHSEQKDEPSSRPQ